MTDDDSKWRATPQNRHSGISPNPKPQTLTLLPLAAQVIPPAGDTRGRNNKKNSRPRGRRHRYESTSDRHTSSSTSGRHICQSTTLSGSTSRPSFAAQRGRRNGSSASTHESALDWSKKPPPPLPPPSCGQQCRRLTSTRSHAGGQSCTNSTSLAMACQPTAASGVLPASSSAWHQASQGPYDAVQGPYDAAQTAWSGEACGPALSPGALTVLSSAWARYAPKQASRCARVSRSAHSHSCGGAVGGDDGGRERKGGEEREKERAWMCVCNP